MLAFYHLSYVLHLTCSPSTTSNRLQIVYSTIPSSIHHAVAYVLMSTALILCLISVPSFLLLDCYLTTTQKKCVRFRGNLWLCLLFSPESQLPIQPYQQKPADKKPPHPPWEFGTCFCWHSRHWTTNASLNSKQQMFPLRCVNIYNDASNV